MKNKTKYEILRERIQSLLSYFEENVDRRLCDDTSFDKGWTLGSFSVLRALLNE